MTSQPYDLSARQMLADYAKGTLSPVDVIDSVLSRAETMNPKINALIYCEPEQARKDAEASALRWRNGTPMGPLDGVPVTVKDSVAMAGRPMARGSKCNLAKPPLTYDSPPVERLKEAGAVLFAKTTMPDFGVLASGNSSAFGVTRNPWNLDCNTGGSSAGAAAALAARCGPLAIGTDVAGSVRFPAAYCGLVGHKPSAGRVPHLPSSPTRVAGPLARTVGDAALLLSVLSQADARDFDSLPPDPTQFHENLGMDLSGVTLGLQLEDELGLLPEPAVAEAVESAARTLEKAGARIVRLPSVVGKEFNEALLTFLMMRGAVEFSNLSDAARADVPAYFQDWFRKADDFSAIDIGRSMDQIEAAKARAMAQLAEVDFLLSPVTGHAAYPAEALEWTIDGKTGLFYAAIWNQTGHPAASVPCGMDSASGLPIGLQVVGHRFNDHGVLQLCAAYEALRGFEMVWPD